MPAESPVWRRSRHHRGGGVGTTPHRGAPGWLAAWLLTGVVAWCSFASLSWPLPAQAVTTFEPQAFLCDGDPLSAVLVKGPMDDPTIPDPSDAPVPVGGGVVLRWRQVSLQLPRTNNAGPASFSDGQWWWSLEDPARPRFRHRRPLGETEEFACAATD